MFDLVAVGRDTAIERMADGMVVVDADNRIADVNETAQKLLAIGRSKVIGSKVVDVMQAYPNLLTLVRDSGTTQTEASFRSTNAC